MALIPIKLAVTTVRFCCIWCHNSNVSLREDGGNWGQLPENCTLFQTEEQEHRDV